MDIHRCRFVPYQPSAINAVAFSHPNPSKPAIHSSVVRLAVGRANGDIEIWNPAGGTWHQELVMRGGKDRSIDGLVWVNEPDQDLGGGRVVLGKLRLFSIGYTSTVTEWDLERGKPKRHASGQHGDIWCLTAQPCGPSDGPTAELLSSNKLIAGTMDGELAMYAIDDGDLRFQRLLVKSPTKKAQMVSIAFQSRRVVIVGCSDSTVRAYDTRQGHLLRRMTLGSDLVGGAKDIIVWSVKCLPDGNIVSGDSTGQICIWDGATYTQSQRIQSHKQDVLSLATSADGSTIMSGGMDRRTCCYKQTHGPGQRWSKVWGRRYHDHDVKAMASFECGRISVVTSGGPDANLMIVPLKEMMREKHRTMSNLPQQPPVLSAPNARFVVSWWNREVHIWVLRKQAAELFGSSGDAIDMNQNRKLLKSIVVKGDSNIASAAVNQDGTSLVVSTATDVKTFRLRHQDPAKPSEVKISSVELPQKLTRLGATQVKLSPDGRWLCLVQEGSRVLMADMGSAQGAGEHMSVKSQRLSRLRRDIPGFIQNGGLGRYDRSITQVAFSPDSRMVAVADLAGYVDTWILRGHEESLHNAKGNGAADDASSSSSSSESDSSEEDENIDASEQWIRNPSAKQFPRLPSAPAVLSFSGTVPGSRGQLGARDEVTEADDYVLAAITLSWNLLVFHPRHGALTAWSRRHPRKLLPAAVQDLMDVSKGILWQGSRMWAYGVSYLLMLDLGQDLPKPTLGAEFGGDPQGAHGTKRKRIGPTTGAGGKMHGENLAPHKVRRRGCNGRSVDVDLGETQRGDESRSEDDMADAEGELAQLRNTSDGTAQPSADAAAEGKKWWITYKYRPILGLVPLGKADGSLEVALVERPAWDVKMPERYFGGDEQDRFIDAMVDITAWLDGASSMGQRFDHLGSD